MPPKIFKLITGGSLFGIALFEVNLYVNFNYNAKKLNKRDIFKKKEPIDDQLNNHVRIRDDSYRHYNNDRDVHYYNDRDVIERDKNGYNKNGVHRY